jgi:hypothetical protein
MKTLSEIKQQIRNERGIKKIELAENDYLYFFYANNKGRGSDNCTIVRSNKERARCTKDQTGIMRITRTGAWRGFVNFSYAVAEKLGVEI